MIEKQMVACWQRTGAAWGLKGSGEVGLAVVGLGFNLIIVLHS